MPTAARRRRVLFVGEAVTLAHVTRPTALARALDPSRFEVHVAWDARYNRLLGELPFPHLPIHTLPTDVFLARVSSGRPMHDTVTLRRYVEDDVAAIRQVNPDVVVGDFRVSLAASARIANVPLVMMANAYWSPYGQQTFEFPAYDYPLTRVVGPAVARRLFRVFRRPGFATHTRPLNRVLREHDLPGIGGDIRRMYTEGDYTAYVDLPELVPTYDRPPRHRYIGPVVWSPAVPMPEWWDALPSNRPIIYATPGSSGEGEVLPLVLEAMADLPVTVIAATAGRIGLERIPANARVADYLPGTAAAARAALVICNGGSPTTYQALRSGVPVLGIAGPNMDQHLNMEAVRRAGAGEVLRARDVHPSQVREAVVTLLEDPRYAAAARGLAGKFEACRPEIRLPALLEEVLG